MTDPNPIWDATLGVWQGEMAAGLALEVLPNPLYIFGYGSLIWNPGAYLKNYMVYHCVAIGCKRLFAQRSCDHRGTVEFPGLVLNLVNDSCLKDLRYLDETAQSECLGMVWHVPADMVLEVVADLDYRERGGYHRQIIHVKLEEDTLLHKNGDIVDALVYTGPQSNPNFFLQPHTRLSRDQDVFSLSVRNSVIDIIVASIGPSGANVDYLFNLERFLHERGMVDDYMVQLADSVRRRVGPWIGRRHRQHLHASPSVTVQGETCVLSGWGSNEFLQLRSTLGGDSNYLSDLHAHHFWATRLSRISKVINNTVSQRDHSCSMDSHVSVGGGTSAVLHPDGTLFMWGKLVPQVLEHVIADIDSGPLSSAADGVCIAGVDCVSIGHDFCLLLLRSGRVLGFGSNSHGQLNGPNVSSGGNVVLESVDGTSTFKIQCKLPSQLEVVSNEDASLDSTFLKLSTGLRHSAAITSDGRLLTWGDSTHGQCLQRADGDSSSSHIDSTVSWRPPGESTSFIDVACGARFTLVVDSAGHIYSLGSDKHGCLGRQVDSESGKETTHGMRRSEVKSSVPGRVEGLPEDVRWQRVVCGWSHVVARGILPSGQLVFWTWGRCDMGQCLSMSGAGEEGKVDGQTPRPLRALPSGVGIAEVWAGSEFSVACDEEGRVWGCGWNEHGNLGNGDSCCNNVLEEWQPALERSENDGESRQIRLSTIWEGALSCGGGHVVCIEQYK